MAIRIRTSDRTPWASARPCQSPCQPWASGLEFFDRYRVIGIDAHLAGNLHRFFGDLARGKLRMLHQRLGCGLRIRTAAANRRHTAVGFDDVSLAAEQKGLLL